MPPRPCPAATPAHDAAVDVAALRIDRTGTRDRRRRRGPGVVPLLLVALLAAGAFWFRTPLVAFLDRARLPRVAALRVVESHPAAAGAVRGAAANGYVVAARRAALSADAPGRIVEMNVTEGSVVRKGEVVARLYADEHRAALERARAELDAARAAVARAEAEHELARTRVEQRRRLVAAAEAALADAQASARLAAIRLQRAEDLRATGVRAQDAVDEALALRDQADAQVAAAQARLDAARADVVDAERQVAVAAADVAVSKAQAQVAAASADQAQATLEKTEVRAPFDGVVVLKDAEVGEVVSPYVQGGSDARGAVCTMVDFASLEVQAEVAEQSLAAVTLGASADVFLDAFPDKRYRGRVDRIWPTADRQKATVEVRIKLLEPDDKLRPEMGVRVVFLPPDADAEAPEARAARILVPETALVEVDGRAGVFVLERDVARFRPVTTGERRSARVEIIDGLRPGQRIVRDPPHELQDGDRVLVEEGS